jgi:GH18 family chitinase
MAGPARPQNIQYLRLAEIGQVVDRINLMVYDYVGSLSDNAGHQANL